MRYRRFGTSELEVSEVGFGTWTLASDWWGVVENKQEMLHTALDAGINFIDTAPVYGNDGIGEILLADVLKTNRDEIVLTTKCGYDHDAARMFPGQSERPQDWEPGSIRLQLEASLRRLGTDYVDLYQLHNARIEPMLDDALWEVLTDLRDEGKVREIGVALGPAIGWVEEGLEAIRRRPIASLQTVFNVLEQEPGLTFAASRDPRAGTGIGLIARVPHASDTLSGKVTRDTVFPPEDHRSHRNPRQHARQLRQGRDAGVPLGGHRSHDGARPRSPASSPTRRSRRCSRPCVDVDDVREYAGRRPTCHSPPTRVARLDELFRENFGIENRYEMPLKSSH